MKNSTTIIAKPNAIDMRLVLQTAENATTIMTCDRTYKSRRDLKAAIECESVLLPIINTCLRVVKYEAVDLDAFFTAHYDYGKESYSLASLAPSIAFTLSTSGIASCNRRTLKVDIGGMEGFTTYRYNEELTRTLDLVKSNLLALSQKIC